MGGGLEAHRGARLAWGIHEIGNAILVLCGGVLHELHCMVQAVHALLHLRDRLIGLVPRRLVPLSRALFPVCMRQFTHQVLKAGTGLVDARAQLSKHCTVTVHRVYPTDHRTGSHTQSLATEGREKKSLQPSDPISKNRFW